MLEGVPSAKGTKKKVLVTGATGTLGTIVTEDLAGQYDFTMTSRRDIPRPGFRRLDIAEESEALAELVAAQDAVIHLAYVEEDDATVTNLKMTKNIYRAALGAPAPPRLVMASSIHAVGGLVDWDREPYASIARRDFASLKSPPKPIPADHPPCPDGVYGALKGYIEILGSYYASCGLEVVAIRFGGVRTDDSFSPEPGYHSFFLSRRDCAEVVKCAAEAELAKRFNVVLAVSRNAWRVHDIEGARRILGFKPQDDAEDLLA